jgi:hypothetical protein
MKTGQRQGESGVIMTGSADVVIRSIVVVRRCVEVGIIYSIVVTGSRVVVATSDVVVASPAFDDSRVVVTTSEVVVASLFVMVSSVVLVSVEVAGGVVEVAAGTCLKQ